MITEAQQKWIDALESGEFNKGSWELYNAITDSYCCLGVACKLAQQEGIIPEGPIEGTYLHSQYAPVKEWLNLREDAGGFGESGKGSSLALENDAHMSFKRVIAIIKARPEGLFKD